MVPYCIKSREVNNHPCYVHPYITVDLHAFWGQSDVGEKRAYS